MLLRFCPYVGTWRFLRWCILILWHVYFGDVWLISAAAVDESYICMLFEFWYEDVASISWIFILFACIIALIEIRRYIFFHISRWKNRKPFGWNARATSVCYIWSKLPSYWKFNSIWWDSTQICSVVYLWYRKRSS